MHLMFIAAVSRMMNADASGLAALTVLALGTFTAGVHIRAWRICLVGMVLALGVPAIAWLEQSALLLSLLAVALVALIAPFVWHLKPTSEPANALSRIYSFERTSAENSDNRRFYIDLMRRAVEDGSGLLRWREHERDPRVPAVRPVALSNSL